MKTKVIYEDNEVLVCYKPAGLAVQTGRIGQADMVSELKNYLKETQKNPYLGLVHRLDQPVEGLLVFGKTQKATAALSEQLQTGTLNKRYYAVVCGKPASDSGELVDYLNKSADNKAEIVTEKEGKKAVLQYKVLGNGVCCEENSENQGMEYTLLDVHIDTGRFHQIRAQLSHAGCPILGDQKYGTEASARLSRELSVRNVALCACEVEFVHPASGEKVSFKENYPLDKLRQNL